MKKMNRPRQIGEWGERGLIQAILPSLRKRFASRFLVPPGDDAAVMRRPHRAVLSIDGLTEGTHFKLEWDAHLRRGYHISLGRALGWKLLGSSLSDLASMGDVRDRWAMIFIGAPASLSSSFLLDFFSGLKEVSRRASCALAGGDTVRSRELTMVAAVGGTLKGPRCLARTGAKPGDLLCVTGPVGDAARGLEILSGHKKLRKKSDRTFFVRRFFQHSPLFNEGKVLAATAGVTSLIDLSDSLQESVEMLISPQNLGYEIEVGDIPLSPPYRRLWGASPSLLSTGEDYSLLFTASVPAVKKLQNKIKFSMIGRILSKGAGGHMTLNGRPIQAPRYFQQFS